MCHPVLQQQSRVSAQVSDPKGCGLGSQATKFWPTRVNSVQRALSSFHKDTMHFDLVLNVDFWVLWCSLVPPIPPSIPPRPPSPSKPFPYSLTSNLLNYGNRKPGVCLATGLLGCPLVGREGCRHWLASLEPRACIR